MKIKKKFLLTAIISGSPGIISIFLSFFALPIFLKYLGSGFLGQYIIQNLFLTISFVLNFGIYRLIIINNNTKNKVINTLRNTFYLQINLILSILASLFIFWFIYELNKIKDIETFDLILNKYLFIGLIVCSIYFSIESIQKNNQKFFHLAFFNLIFNGVSFAAPAFYLLLKDIFTSNSFYVLEYPEELIKITVIIKIISLILFYFISIYQNTILNIFKKIRLTKFEKNDLNEIFYATNQSFIFFLNNILDKFFIKFSLGNAFLATYSVPQQIAGKSTILITAISTVFFPKVSKASTSNIGKKIYLIYVLRITIFLTGFLSFSSFPLIEPVIKLWLGENNLEIYTSLIKFFLFYSFFASINYLISQYLDSQKKIKANSIIDILFFFVSLLMFIFILQYESLIIFALAICAREIMVFCFKNYYFGLFKIILKELKVITLYTLLFISALFFINIYIHMMLIFLLIFYYFLKFKKNEII